jgi:chemotaxis protein methyltransferase CheR
VIGGQTPLPAEAFRDAVARHLGLWFDGERLDWLNEALQRRLAATGLGRDEYLARFADDTVRRHEIAALAPELTVNETFFFRYPSQFRALAEVVFPQRMAAHAHDRRLRVLSAGCASGEETYSIAITAAGVVPPAWDLSIVGVDLNPANIERATRARYSDWALRETPDAVRRRWFSGHGRDTQLSADARAAVRFRTGNLVDDDRALWAPDTYDAVFLRNVLIYFTPAQMQALLARVALALQPGGFLFLGHAETVRGLSDAFVLRHTHEAFYYQRPADGAAVVAPQAGASNAIGMSAARVASPIGAPPAAADWVDAVSRSAARLARIGLSEPARTPGPVAAREAAAGAPGTAASPEAPSPLATGSPDAARARELLASEQYAELDALLAAQPGDASRDPALLLVAAAADTHRGRIAEAEAACGRLLHLDPLNADAYGLLALCRDAAGDPAAAEQHDESALYLEPDRPMPHVHLGLLARRRGDRARAQRLFQRALALLPLADENGLRVAGAGLGRDGLVALCRAELERLRRPA